MLKKHIRYLIYIIVVMCFGSVHGGSFDDFFIAIRNDNASAIADLLKRGFDPNTRDETGQPGLTIAMQERSLNAARALLASKPIDVDALNSAGETALMMAALKGELTGAQWLLDRGARINRVGWSALHYAATGPEPKLVQLLLDRGAEIDAQSPNGTTPLMMAAHYGSEDSVKLLLARGSDTRRRNHLGLSVMDFAKKSGRAPLVDYLERSAR